MTLPLPDPVGEAKTIFLSVVGAILIGLIVWLGWSKANVETDLAKSQIDNTALTAANENWKQQVDQQNALIDDMVAEEKKRDDAATAAISAAQKEAQTYAAQAALIIQAKPVGDDCIATKHLADSYYGARP